MEGQLYIRFRGRVLGPYDEEQLQTMSRKGQLSRMHELSVDGVSWQRAADFPELFVSSIVVETPLNPPQAQPAPVQAAPVVPTGTPIAAPGRAVMPAGAPSLAAALPAVAAPQAAPAPARRPAPPNSTNWYYMDGNDRRGPVTFDALQMLSQSGHVRVDTLVWTDGLATWTPAGKLQGLVSQSASSHSASSDVFDIVDADSRRAAGPYAYYGRPHATQNNGLAVAGMVTGIVGLVLTLLPFVWILGIALDVVAVVLSGVAMGAKGPKGPAIAGLVCGLIGIILWLIVVLTIGLMIELWEF